MQELPCRSKRVNACLSLRVCVCATGTACTRGLDAVFLLHPKKALKKSEEPLLPVDRQRVPGRPSRLVHALPCVFLSVWQWVASSPQAC